MDSFYSFHSCFLQRVKIDERNGTQWACTHQFTVQVERSKTAMNSNKFMLRMIFKRRSPNGMLKSVVTCTGKHKVGAAYREVTQMPEEGVSQQGTQRGTTTLILKETFQFLVFWRKDTKKTTSADLSRSSCTFPTSPNSTAKVWVFQKSLSAVRGYWALMTRLKNHDTAKSKTIESIQECKRLAEGFQGRCTSRTKYRDKKCNIPTKLLDVTQTLELRRVDDFNQERIQLDVPMYWIIENLIIVRRAERQAHVEPCIHQKDILRSIKNIALFS